MMPSNNLVIFPNSMHSLSLTSRSTLASRSNSVSRSTSSSLSGSPLKLRDMATPETGVGQWLIEIRRKTEMESLTALQAKSVAIEEDSVLALAVRCAQVSVRKIRFSSVQIIDDIDLFIDTLPVTCKRLRDCQHDFMIICDQISALIDLCPHRKAARDVSGLNKLAKIAEGVLSICDTLNLFMTDFVTKNKVNNAQLEAYLRKLKEKLGELVDTTIRRECQIIITGLGSPIESLCLKWSIFALWQLTKNDAYICRLFVENPSIIKRLVEILASNTGKGGPFRGQNQLRAASLRTLTHLCINPEAIRSIYNNLDLDKHIIIPLQSVTNEVLLREITGFLVQITTPFIDYKQTIKKDNVLASFIETLPLDELIQSLIKVANETQSREIFLLVTACLANISFYDPSSITRNQVLTLLMAKTRTTVKLYKDTAIKDQMITVMANVSSIDTEEIVQCGALVYLVCALQIRPILTDDDGVELAAIGRIQQKVATALTRLADRDKSTAQLIYELKGCHRLVQICRDPKERNYNDYVLVASLIAIRRITSKLKSSIVKELNIQDLIQPDPEQALRQCSQVNESYV